MDFNVLRALGQISSYLSAFAAGQVAAYKIFETINRTPQIDAFDMRGIELDDMIGEIELRDVYFRYPARPDVQIFSGLSMHIPNSQTVALVGQSGSGKSSVISLLERFYDPDAGEVLIDGINIKRFKLKWLREKIGLVSQEPILFATTLKENIAYGKENATDLEIRTALQIANAANFIDELPKVQTLLFLLWSDIFNQCCKNNIGNSVLSRGLIPWLASMECSYQMNKNKE